jgi:transketolase C-terminal domain/subunit
LGELKYEIGQKYATRNAYGDALKRLGENDKNKVICGLDGDTKNSTFAITF